MAALDSQARLQRDRAGAVSPELALVDPELADSARRTLPLPRTYAGREGHAPAAARVAPGRRGAGPFVVAACAVGLLIGALLPLAWRVVFGSSPSAQPVQEGAGPAPGAGYVSGSVLRLEVAPDGIVVRSVTMSLRCAGAVTLPAMAIDAGSSFAYHGTVQAPRGAVAIDLNGRFLTRAAAAVTVRANWAGCIDPRRRYVARLS